MRRRALLATLPFAFAGCTAIGSDRPDDATPVPIDCRAAQRPAPEADAADAVEPRPYPDPPSPGGVGEWTVAHERAYVTNSILASETVASLSIEFEQATTASRSAGVVCSVDYGYSYQSDGAIADAPDAAAAYYVADRGALRVDGVGPATELDPVADGEPVVCF